MLTGAQSRSGYLRQKKEGSRRKKHGNVHMCVGGRENLQAIKIEFLGVSRGKGKAFQRALQDKI